MAIEKFWERQGPFVFTADGTEGGLVTVASIELLKVKQMVKISAIGEPDKVLQVKRVLSPTQLIVGPKIDKIKSKDNLKAVADISAYTTAKSATIVAVEQPKVLIPEKDIIQAVYEFEPTVAIRTHDVDRWGRPWNVDNPFPVQLSDGDINIGTVNGELEVQLNHLDNDPDAGDVHDSVRIGDGKKQAKINENGILQAEVADRTIFGSLLTEFPIDEINLNFTKLDPDIISDVDSTGTGSVIRVNNGAEISSGSGATATAELQTRQIIRYISGHESRADFTASFTAGTPTSTQFIGTFNSLDGYSIGYEGTVFGIKIIDNGSVTFIPQSSFSVDTLSGGPNSYFTRDGVAEALNPSNLNVYRIRYGWLGSSTVLFEIMAPDGNYVTFHKERLPNSSTSALISDPNLPLRAEVTKSGGGSEDIILRTNSMRGCTHGSVNLNRISTANSSYTALPGDTGGSDHIFVGKAEDVSQFTNVSVQIIASHASAENGMIMEFSPDGVNWDTNDTYTIGADDGDIFTAGIAGQFFRARYINGPDAQSFFRLQTIFHVTPPKSSSHRIDDAIDGQNDAELVKSVATGKDPNGLFVNKPASGISEANSTTIPLLASAEFVGDFIDLKNFGGIAVAVDTDQSGELFIEGSTDGITVNTVVSDFDVAAGEPFFIGVSPRRRYARIRYANGPIDQGSFDLQTIITVNQLSPSSQPINSQLSGTSIAVTNRSILAGQREDGDFDNVDLSNSSSVKVAVTDRPSEVRGRTHVNINIPKTSVDPGGNIFYTVTPGRILYVTAFLLTSLNDGAGPGEYSLRDGTVKKSTFILGARISGSTPSAANVSSPTLPEPMIFTTNVNLQEVAGIIFASGFLIGYEE